MDNATHSHILHLQEAMKQNRLVVFVGAGASASVGVPTWPSLIQSFKTELPVEMYDEGDPLKTAEAYRELRGDVEYLAHVKKVLKHGDTSSGLIHDAIMDLNPCHIVTTNYDDLLEQAAIYNNKQYYVVAKDEDLPLNKGEKMIIKMHGDFVNNNIVLTENDYYDYRRNFPLVNSFLLSLFATKVVLFVGFSFNDINLKFILRQVSSILGNKMQRVYLLTDERKDALAYSYFKSKSVQLLSIPNDVAVDTLKTQHIDSPEAEELPLRSQSLYYALRVLKAYDSHYDSLIDKAIDVISLYQEQIRYWGKYLARLFSWSTNRYFSLDSTNLDLPDEYKEKFKDIVQLKKNAPLQYQQYQGKIQWLKQKLYENGVESVEDHVLVTGKQKVGLIEARQNDLSSIFYRLSIIDIEYRLQYLMHRTLNYTIEDLELPFLQYRLGKYYEAYMTYKTLAPEMWKRRKYVLYFLCLYNMKASFVYAPMQMMNRELNIYKESDYLEKIQLREILETLPIETTVKRILADLVNGVLLNEHLIKTTELSRKLIEQRERAERGGMSLNGNIAQLLNEFLQAFNFCNENYILNESYTTAQNAYIQIGNGLINSVLTPEDEHHIQSKIDELPEIAALLFVFHVRPSELKQILKNANGKKIPAENAFRRRLKMLVDNLADDLHGSTEGKLISPRLVQEYIGNIILLQNAIENPLPIPEIFTVIAGYYNSWYQMQDEVKRGLLRIIEKQKPSPQNAVDLLDLILHAKINYYNTDDANLIGVLANIAKEGNMVLTDFPGPKKLSKMQDLICVASYYNALSTEDQTVLKSYVREQTKHICDLLLAEVHTEAHYISALVVEKLSDSITKQHPHYRWVEPFTCSHLARILRNADYADVHEAINKLREGNMCLRFMCNPTGFTPVENISGEWLIYVSDEDLRQLYENTKVRKIAVKYCDEHKWDSSLIDKMLRFLRE